MGNFIGPLIAVVIVGYICFQVGASVSQSACEIRLSQFKHIKGNVYWLIEDGAGGRP